MSWAFEFTPAAEEDLKALPKAIQKRVARVTAQMADDPFKGNERAYKARSGRESSGAAWASTGFSSRRTRRRRR
jgi:mRNA-degrading endonuclease RelE of RelBE toxin-antitoxin system